MRIIEIEALSNGAHRNQTASHSITIPEGWALLPDYIVTNNFPFGEILAEEINGVMTVIRWVAGEMPEPEPEPEPDEGDEAVTWNELAQAYSEGVNSIDE